MVSCIEKKQYGLNLFKWPKTLDIELYNKSDLLLEISEISPFQTSTDIIWCALEIKDFNDANELLKRMLDDE